MKTHAHYLIVISSMYDNPDEAYQTANADQVADLIETTQRSNEYFLDTLIMVIHNPGSAKEYFSGEVDDDCNITWVRLKEEKP